MLASASMDPSRPCVRDVIAQTTARLDSAKIPSARLEAELLLADSLGRDRTWLATHPREALSTPAIGHLEERLRRRLQRQPLQYIVGHQEFWGLDFEVDSNVLIPRPETELLVEKAIVLGAKAATICDVGTGSGCIAVALASELPQARFTATDLSAAALQVAAGNARRHGVAERIGFLQADLLEAVDTTFSLIVSNPPYVGTRERRSLQPELAFEPASALFAGDHGLDVIRRLLPQAWQRLLTGGALLMEIGCCQDDEVAGLAIAVGFSSAHVEVDLAKLPRLLVAVK